MKKSLRIFFVFMIVSLNYNGEAFAAFNFVGDASLSGVNSDVIQRKIAWAVFFGSLGLGFVSFLNLEKSRPTVITSCPENYRYECCENLSFNAEANSIAAPCIAMSSPLDCSSNVKCVNGNSFVDAKKTIIDTSGNLFSSIGIIVSSLAFIINIPVGFGIVIK